MSTRFIRFLLAALVAFGLTRQLAAQLVLDSAKPYVYVKFDHAGKPALNEKRESNVLWLRLARAPIVTIIKFAAAL